MIKMTEETNNNINIVDVRPKRWHCEGRGTLPNHVSPNTPAVDSYSVDNLLGYHMNTDEQNAKVLTMSKKLWKATDQ